ncbi:hypothetical protein [Cedecea davisae]|uniref:hypothetical protein n=1 Tax=Cedecea davisae TaxID=158484 RepID=UPI002430D8A4|nr:hypothetical protein [Cedecea davisae]
MTLKRFKEFCAKSAFCATFLAFQLSKFRASAHFHFSRRQSSAPEPTVMVRHQQTSAFTNERSPGRVLMRFDELFVLAARHPARVNLFI